MINDQSRLRERSVGLFVLGMLTFNFPLLSLFSTDFRILGVPLLFCYLFGAWLSLIIGIALTTGRAPGDGDSDANGGS